MVRKVRKEVRKNLIFAIGTRMAKPSTGNLTIDVRLAIREVRSQENIFVKRSEGISQFFQLTLISFKNVII